MADVYKKETNQNAQKWGQRDGSAIQQEFVKDPSSDSSTHIGCLTTAYNISIHVASTLPHTYP